MTLFCLVWPEESDFRHFIDVEIPRAVQKKHECQRLGEDSSLTFVLDEFFVTGYLGLDEQGLVELLRSLSTVPLDALQVVGDDKSPYCGSPYAYRKRKREGDNICQYDKARWIRLFQHMSGIPTMKEISFYLDNTYDPRYKLDDMLQFLSMIETVKIWDDEYSHWNSRMEEIARGIKHHPTIQKVFLRIHTIKMPTILPALHTMPLLQSVDLGGGFSHDGEVYFEPFRVEPRESLAIADTLANQSLMHMHIERLDFSKDTMAYQIFRNGIKSAGVSRLELAEITLPADRNGINAFVQALADSNLQMLCLGKEITFKAQSLINAVTHYETSDSDPSTDDESSVSDSDDDNSIYKAYKEYNRYYDTAIANYIDDTTVLESNDNDTSDSCGDALVAAAIYDNILSHPDNNLPDYTGCDVVARFIATLASKLSKMQRLEVLDCGEYHNCIYREMPAILAEAAIRCTSLHVLRLPVQKYSARMDEALAANVLINPNLEEIVVRSGGLHGRGAFHFPALLRAVRHSFTIKQIHLKSHDELEYSFWDADMTRELDVFLRLNRSGRGNLDSDPGNVRKFVKILDQVKDDTYCIFVLLQGNLFAFGSYPAHPAARTE
ncbi:hypothetical protein MPSEU_000867100 [Mayamaea pseudoterrestris]|nr:hypothetical protein MPSEU_000867100 [Mayamaea pseudoterrestris]